jgi:predicted transcriptional regulator
MARTSSHLQVAATLRGRRRDLDLTQVEITARAGVSRQRLSGLEGGKVGAELGLVLRVLNVLGLQMDLRVAGVEAPATSRPVVDLDALLNEYDADGNGSG